MGKLSTLNTETLTIFQEFSRDRLNIRITHFFWMMKAHYRLIKGNHCSFLQVSADERFIKCSEKLERKKRNWQLYTLSSHDGFILFQQLPGFNIQSYSALIGIAFYSQGECSDPTTITQAGKKEFYTLDNAEWGEEGEMQETKRTGMP